MDGKMVVEPEFCLLFHQRGCELLVFSKGPSPVLGPLLTHIPGRVMRMEHPILDVPVSFHTTLLQGVACRRLDDGAVVLVA
jgi:hypothetical protein